MKNAQAELAAHYAAMDDSQLLDLAAERHTLTEIAFSALAAEMEKRNLTMPLPEGYVEVVPQKLVTVESFRDLAEASIARSVLESAGIPVYLSEENVIRMNWLFSGLLGGIKLQVSEEDAEAALEILSQPLPENIPLEEDQSFSQPRCPQCDSLEIIHGSRNSGLKLAALNVVGLPLPLPKDALRCNSCGYTWKEETTE